MLPFLQDKDGVMAQPAEELEYGALDAVCEDILRAVDKNDKSLLKQALEALCEYVRSEDLEQDKSLTNKE